jgi:hypothetical protein
MVSHHGEGSLSYREPLSQKAIGISISLNRDMEVFGLAEEHFHDAMAEVARHLLAMGARLVYGGDLRADGFTELLFELVARHRRDADLGDDRPAVENYLAWPVHRSMRPETAQELLTTLKDLAELHFLDLRGNELSTKQLQMTASPVTSDEWFIGLTTMRHVLTAKCDARILLGGNAFEFKGKMPGVAEEALLCIKAQRPLYVLGGFGGCARDIAEELGLLEVRRTQATTWADRSLFSSFTARTLNNGLNSNENKTLARTVHIDEAVTLVLRGLLRHFSKSDTRASGV